MRFYNTMSNKIEEFETIEKGKVKMYVCGPTVYNYIHLGNARPIIVFDTLARYFKYRGYDVTYIQNFTDVDDKIIKRANEEGISVKEVTEKYIKGFFEDIEPLNISDDIIRPKVTENMPEIIEIIKKLIDEGFAYEKDGNVFFEVKKFEEYGSLSNQKIDELEIGARVDIMEEKNNPLDFALWKRKKEGEPYWESPWGQGRPGWHIECSAMAKKYLGDTFDIHGGGQDLVFPHHENEIAQSRCAYHGNFANYWLHNGFIQVNGDKMSKSLGNFFLLREILGKIPGNVVRLFILGTHYRKPINFSMDNMEDSRKTLKNIVTSMNNFSEIIEKFSGKGSHEGEVSDNTGNNSTNEFKEKVNELDKKFMEAMDEDMNTPQALAVIFDQIKETKKFSVNILNGEEAEALNYSYNSLRKKLEEVLGIMLFMEDENKNFKNNDKLTGNLIELLIKLRADARKEKNFKLSDEIRDNLKELGIEIQDNKDGTTGYTIQSNNNEI
ncbi:cysteine--tRNA ligase [Leptotrichia sp. oral taxon 215]|uniref:cysteine--tRNA ligase n=1 Tax=Leptotrichia sp. oral taxon 215 TaxID=712359 RepID=UPI0004017324|nr:cysteine--tRNA ligase [Leptotrichia sp. oral taxon 215]